MRGRRDPRPPATWEALGVRALVLADTHIHDDLRRIPPAVWDEAARADLILHAGDVVTPHLLTELGRFAPVHAVLGNNDHALRRVLPHRLEIEVAGVAVAIVHDSGAGAGRGERLARWFPDAALVVFGHSHLPEDEVGPGGQVRFNPGSSTQRRRAPHRTYGVVELDGGRILRRSTVVVA